MITLEKNAHLVRIRHAVLHVDIVDAVSAHGLPVHCNDRAVSQIFNKTVLVIYFRGDFGGLFFQFIDFYGTGVNAGERIQQGVAVAAYGHVCSQLVFVPVQCA